MFQPRFCFRKRKKKKAVDLNCIKAVPKKKMRDLPFLFRGNDEDKEKKKKRVHMNVNKIMIFLIMNVFKIFILVH